MEAAIAEDAKDLPGWREGDPTDPPGVDCELLQFK